VDTDATRMCELLVGLPAVTILGVEDRSPTVPLRVEIETRLELPVACASCGTMASVKDRPRVALVDLPAFGRPTRLMWRKRRWACLAVGCAVGSWTELAPKIAASRLLLTDRAGRWVTWQVGKHGRTVSEVAAELGCDWHTVNDATIAYGSALVDDPARIGEVTALGLDETLFTRIGRWRTKQWSTSIVDVRKGQLLDVVEGRDAAPACRWLEKQGPAWCGRIRYGTLDMSGPYRKVFDTMLPDVTQVVDPFHLVKLGGQKLDDVRRRVNQEIVGHRGRKDDPLYRARKLLVMAHERLDEHAAGKLTGLLAAGDPHGEVTTAWHAN